MSEKDWDNYDREELLNVAPALLDLRRRFGTPPVGQGEPAREDSEGADRQDSGKPG